MFQADSLAEPGPGDIDAKPKEATSDTPVGDGFSTLRPARDQQSSVDARKRKVIDIPMV